MIYPQDNPKAGAEPLSPLSSDLQALHDRLDGNSLTVREIEQSLKGRGFAILILLMTIPFCLIPVPGLSTPFGIAILIMGFRMACGQKPWLPDFILNKEVPHDRLKKLLKMSAAVSLRLEKLVKPRMRFLQRWPGMVNLTGASIASGGLLLLIPLPFSNWLPAWAILLLTAGMMEKDGLLVLIGQCLTLVSWALVISAWVFGVKGIEKLFNLF
jgi:hypothetical protein